MTQPTEIVPGTYLEQGNAQIAVGGTAVIVVPATTARSLSVLVKALSTNTGSLYLGDSTVTSSNGVELQPGEAWSGDLNHQATPLYINGANVGDAVRWHVLGAE